ncbi:MAG: hypothetical protein R3F02_18175 [Thiolinea sp.]
MPNLIDIPTVVGTLVTYFAMGGNEAAVEAIKGMAVNATLKLSELKDQLLGKPEVKALATQVQAQPLDMELQQQLRDMLTQELERHPAFQQQTAVQVQGDIKAENGSVAAAVINGGTISITNTHNED